MNPIPRTKNAPPPGWKLVRDWVGKRVRTVRDLENRACIVPKGTLAVVTQIRGTGLEIRCEPCNGCGIAMTFSRVSSSDVRLEADLRSVFQAIDQVWEVWQAAEAVLRAEDLRPDSRKAVKELGRVAFAAATQLREATDSVICSGRSV